MSLKYHIQELPDLHGGERKLYPKLERYSSFGNDKIVERISLESGIRESSVAAVLDSLPDALTAFLLEGHTVKIDGFGTFSLSLTSNRQGEPVISRLNLRSDPEFIDRLRGEASFEKSKPEVVAVSCAKDHFEEHLALLRGWMQTHRSITLQEYANLAGISASSASRELRRICKDPSNHIAPSGPTVNRCWHIIEKDVK